MGSEFTPQQLLAAYTEGYFPMADPDEGNRIYWYAPDPRAVIPLDRFKVSRSLRARIRKAEYSISFDLSFSDVIDACADRIDTWISGEIVELYSSLHDLGFAHSVEAWKDDELVGGLYGVAINGLFCGESMFSKSTDASKVALAALVERLHAREFVLLDVQFMTEHLRTFGAEEIPKAEYEARLRTALAVKTSWI